MKTAEQPLSALERFVDGEIKRPAKKIELFTFIESVRNRITDLMPSEDLCDRLNYDPKIRPMIGIPNTIDAQSFFDKPQYTGYWLHYFIGREEGWEEDPDHGMVIALTVDQEPTDPVEYNQYLFIFPDQIDAQDTIDDIEMNFYQSLNPKKSVFTLISDVLNHAEQQHLQSDS